MGADVAFPLPNDLFSSSGGRICPFYMGTIYLFPEETLQMVLYLWRQIIKGKTMKKTLYSLVTIISLALFGSINAIAQEDVTDTTSHKEVGMDFYLPEDNIWHPSFMGRDKNEFSKWVKEHQRYPKKAKKAGIQGRVVVGFTIDEKGRMADVQLVRGVHPLLDKEALRVIKSAPKKWTAGTRNGKPSAFKYTMAVGFNLPESQRKSSIP